jgi:hypothetical protein
VAQQIVHRHRSRRRGPAVGDPRELGVGVGHAHLRRIGDLLKRYEAELGGIRELFGRGANESGKPQLGEKSERRLQQVSTAFLRDLAGMGLGLSDLQKFKDSYKIVGGGGHRPRSR